MNATIQRYLEAPCFSFQEIVMAVHVCQLLRWLGALGR